MLARRGGPIDVARGRRRDELTGRPPIGRLVDCLVVPWVESLRTAEGRAHVRIVDQLRGRFAAWRTESDPATTAHLVRVLDELERRGGEPSAADRERVVGMIVLLTGLTADRARRLDDGVALELDHDGFVAALTDMCTAVVRC